MKPISRNIISHTKGLKKKHFYAILIEGKESDKLGFVGIPVGKENRETFLN